MKRQITSKIYDLYFNPEDERLIFSVLKPFFDNFTYSRKSCVWHNKFEPTLHITILDDRGLGYEVMIKQIKLVIALYVKTLGQATEVLLTVTNCKAYFLNGEKA